MSEDSDDSDRKLPDGGGPRSSISVGSDTKARFDTLRRQLSAHEDEDMTGDDTLARLMDYFEETHEWADTDGDEP